jgi:hypothetical protein
MPLMSLAQNQNGRSLDQGGESCATAVQIPGYPFIDNGITGETDDCLGMPFFDVFYWFVAPQTGFYTADVCFSPGGISLRAWLNGCGNPNIPMLPNGQCGNNTQPTLQLHLAAGQTVYFEVGTALPSIPPQPYVFSLQGPPPENPQIQLNEHDLVFPATHVGDVSAATVTVANVGSGTLNVQIEPTSPAFVVEPSLLALAAGESQPVTLLFMPFFDHDFTATALFRSNSVVQPVDSVRMTGTGCPPVSLPLPPRLFDAGASDAIYWAMPWDQNAQSTEYAVEFSEDNFMSAMFVQPAIGHGSDPAYLTASMWAVMAHGAITGLSPNTTCQVRLRARDCTGLEIIGPSATMTTRPAFNPGSLPFGLTIRSVNADSIELNWQPLDEEAHHNGFVDVTVYVDESVNGPGQPVAVTTANSIRLPVTSPRSFYSVRANFSGTFAGIHPYIAWPPEGALLSGSNTVIVNDFLHVNEWDSFRVDVNGQFVGSNRNCPWSESGVRGIPVDFGQFDHGPAMIQVTVVTPQGVVVTVAGLVMIQSTGHAEFVPHYYELPRPMASADTANVQPPSAGGVVNYLWEMSKVDERYGTSISFDWPASADSLVLIHCSPIPDMKILTEDPNWYKYAAEPAGVKTVTFDPVVWVWGIHCCCDDMTILSAGTANGDYGGTKNFPLGAIVRCDPETRDYFIGFSFEIEATIKWELAEDFIICYWGQDCKRTSTTETGSCNNAGVFQPAVPPETETSHKEHGGNDYPRDGANWGNDDYRPDNHGETLDMSQLIKGTVRWLDVPNIRGTRPRNRAIRDTRHAAFSARIDPQCQPVNIICCQQWEVEWDVTICPGCVVTQTVAPRIFNQSTPADCPTLAEN